MNDGFVVTSAIEGANPYLPRYPLLPGDLLVREGLAYHKECPGISVGGFVLTAEQEASLRPVKFEVHGLEYVIL